MWSEGLWEIVEGLDGIDLEYDGDGWLRGVVDAMPARIDEALRLRRARRGDRVALAETSAWAVVWFAAATGVGDVGARRRALLSIGDRAARRVGETLPDGDDGEAFLLAAAAIAAARAEDAVEGLVGEAEGVERFAEGIRDTLLDRLRGALDGGDVDGLRNHVYWQGQEVSIAEALAAARDPRLQHRLSSIAAAHRRASGIDLPSVPVIGIGDERWFVHLDARGWAHVDDPARGRTKAGCVQRRLVLLGDVVSDSVERSADNGLLNVHLMHELLHTVQLRSPAGDGDAKRLDSALMEGAHQRWAESVCRTGRDPVSGLSGAGATNVYCGWKYAVGAIAEATGRDPTVAARELAMSARSFSEVVSEWCDRDRLVERLWPVMDRAFRDRRTGGIGPRTARETLAALEL